MTREELLEKLIQEKHLRKSELEILSSIDEENGYQLKFIEEFTIRLLYHPKIGLVKVETWDNIKCNGGYETDWISYYHYLAK